MKSQYIILSVERRAPNGFFIAIHGYSPTYGPAAKARKFDTYAEAKKYANDELFTTADASVICDEAGNIVTK
jgi:hypothetical protein